MVIGLTLILIVVIPLCIYLYLENKFLKIELEKTKLDNKDILERKIINNKSNDIESLQELSTPPNTNSKEYLEEISENINKEIESKNIELTEEEHKQEEQAIISYQELKKHLEEKSNNISLKDTEKFIENLKNLRNNLNKNN